VKNIYFKKLTKLSPTSSGLAYRYGFQREPAGRPLAFIGRKLISLQSFHFCNFLVKQFKEVGLADRPTCTTF